MLALACAPCDPSRNARLRLHLACHTPFLRCIPGAGTESARKRQKRTSRRDVPTAERSTTKSAYKIRGWTQSSERRTTRSRPAAAQLGSALPCKALYLACISYSLSSEAAGASSDVKSVQYPLRSLASQAACSLRQWLGARAHGPVMLLQARRGQAKAEEGREAKDRATTAS